MKPGSFFVLIFFTSISFAIASSFAGAQTAWEKIPAADFVLPAPPNAQRSAIEINVLLKLQDERTETECELGQRQANPEFKKLFSDGPEISSQELKTVAPLLERVSQLGERIANHFKSMHRRQRPYDFDSRVRPCVKLPGGAKSYPSSHAIVATLDACVLAGLFPQRAAGLDALGVTLSERRMKIGVHFPSDVRAGQKLALEICRRLTQDASFSTEFERLRKIL